MLFHIAGSSTRSTYAGLPVCAQPSSFGSSMKQCGQAYQNTSTTSTLPGATFVGCAGCSNLKLTPGCSSTVADATLATRHNTAAKAACRAQGLSFCRFMKRCDLWWQDGFNAVP